MNIISALSVTLLTSMALDPFQTYKTQDKFQVTKRTILYVVCVFGMFIFYSYNAILISSLMVQEYKIPIKKLEDLLLNPSYKLLIFAGSSAETDLRGSNNPIHKKIWEKVLNEDGIVNSLDNAEEKLLSDEYNVLYYTYPEIPIMYKSYPCEITADKTTILREFGTYPFHKDSPYVSLFDHHLYNIEEQGLETEFFDRQEENEFSCEEESLFLSITFDGVYSAFALLGMGCLIASTCYVAEKYYSKHLIKVEAKKEHFKETSK